VTPITQDAQGKADNSTMANKDSKPILEVVKRMHAEADKAQGVDPYNTARMRALAMKPGTTEEQQKEAAGILACFEKELSL
jgi:hypothetical protein